MFVTLELQVENRSCTSNVTFYAEKKCFYKLKANLKSKERSSEIIFGSSRGYFCEESISVFPIYVYRIVSL